MAEGWGKTLKGDSFNFFSAGTKKHGLNPIAVKVMKEVGIDIGDHESNTIDELPENRMDFVFTVCSNAHENCPFFAGGKVVHVGFDDPPTLTRGLSNEDEVLTVYRRVRDEIKKMVMNIESYVKDEK